MASFFSGLMDKPGTVSLTTPDRQSATMMWQLALPINDRHPDYAALMMANHLLGSGGNSRLWNRLRETDGLSYSVYSALDWSSRDENTRWFAMAMFAPQNRVRIEQAMREELQRALRDGFTQAELDQGKEGLLSFRRLGRAQDARLAASWVALLDLGRRFDESSKLDAALGSLTLSQVNAALRQYLKTEQLVWGWAGDFADRATQ